MRSILLTIFLFIGLSSYSQVDTAKLNSFIKEWWNVPYVLGGNSKKGIDCSRFTQRIYKEVFDKVIPNVSWKQWRATKRVSKKDLQTGDLVFFRSKISPSGWHVGLYLWDNLFVHAANKKEDIKISILNEDNYRLNYKGAGRL